MKKTLALSLLLVLGFTLTGCTLVDKLKSVVSPKKEGETITNVESLIQSGESKKCTYTTEQDGRKLEGTMYIADKKLRGDSTYNSEEGPVEYHYIADDTWIYTWGTNMPAIKTNISETKDLARKYQEGQTPEIPKANLENTPEISNEELERNTDMKCSSWKADSSMFTPPTNVTFQDMTELIKGLPKPEDLKQNNCSVCNVAPDEKTKSECKASIGCN